MIDAGTQIRRIKRLRNSPTLRSIVVYGASGAGFAGANLILAYELPRQEYALFTLVLALVNLAAPASPLGLDALVLRRRLTIGEQVAEAPAPRRLGRHRRLYPRRSLRLSP